MARVGVIFWASLVAWVIGSSAYSLVKAVTPTPTDTEASPKTFLDQRKAAQNKSPGVIVAVTLSGGGYRAATIHAGVLKILEVGDQEGPIPVHYLSTVSGGSIIGAHYALGHSPEKFISLLESKPGLANDLFHIWNVMKESIGPSSMRDSDTYADHFRRVYFGNRTFKDLTGPELIVNATTYKDRSRFVFSSATTPNVTIADAVAASGAFPGAFEPKRVAVPSNNGQVEDQDFIDGGVVENLGLEGLREYLKKTLPSPNTANTGNTGKTCRAGLPDVLIVSDASKADKDPKGGSKQLRLTLLKEASSTSYLALHRKLYRLFTNNQYNPNNSYASGKSPVQPFFQGHQHLFDPADLHDCYLFTFVLDGTNPEERRDMEKAGARPADVAAFSTLEELDKEEVQMGVTLGETIAKKYLTVIGCVIRKIPALKQGKGMSPEAIQQACRDKVRT